MAKDFHGKFRLNASVTLMLLERLEKLVLEKFGTKPSGKSDRSLSEIEH